MSSVGATTMVGVSDYHTPCVAMTMGTTSDAASGQWMERSRTYSMHGHWIMVTHETICTGHKIMHYTHLM